MLFQKTLLIHFWKTWLLDLYKCSLPLELTSCFSKVILSLPSCTFRESHQTNSSRAYVTPQMYFSLSSGVTVPRGHFWKREQLGTLSLWEFPGTDGLYTMICLCQEVARVPPQCHQSPGYRKARVGSVAQRDKNSLINPGPPCALTDVQRFIRLANTGNPVWKTISWFGWGRESKEIVSSAATISNQHFSLSVIDTPGWISLFIHSLIHWTSTEGNVPGEVLSRETRAKKPHTQGN